MDYSRTDMPANHSFTKLQGQYLASIATYTKLHRRPPSEANLQEYFRRAETAQRPVRFFEQKRLSPTSSTSSAPSLDHATCLADPLEPPPDSQLQASALAKDCRRIDSCRAPRGQSPGYGAHPG